MLTAVLWTRMSERSLLPCYILEQMEIFQDKTCDKDKHSETQMCTLPISLRLQLANSTAALFLPVP